jgi:outer membrane immunogenic protein
MRGLLAAGALLVGLSGFAQAADLSYPAPSAGAGPMMAPTFNWAGTYFGAQIGGGWMNVDRLTSTGSANSYNGSGFVGGLFLGYNWVSPNDIVWGVEADGNFANISGNDGTVGGTTDGTRIN